MIIRSKKLLRVNSLVHNREFLIVCLAMVGMGTANTYKTPLGVSTEGNSLLPTNNNYC